MERLGGKHVHHFVNITSTVMNDEATANFALVHMPIAIIRDAEKYEILKIRYTYWLI